MNKKFTKLIAFLLVLTTLLFTACSSNKTVHVHDFIVQSSDAKFLSEEATCSSPALYYLSCSCGEKGDKTFEFGTKSMHEYTQKIENDKYLKEEATCSSPAVYYKACKWCGKKGSLINTFVSNTCVNCDYTQETVADKYLKSEPTKESPAVYYKSCKWCGSKGESTFEYGEKLREYTDAEKLTYKPTSLTVTLYDAENSIYGFTFNTQQKPIKPIIQIEKGDSLTKNCQEYIAKYTENTSYTANDQTFVFYVAKVEIELEPNTTYVYRAYDKHVDVGTETVSFTTKNPKSDTFTFSHISDSQTSASDNNAVGSGNYFNQTLSNLTNSDFLLHTGDFVEWSKYESYWKAMLDDNFSYLSKMPVMAISGNHETTYRNGANETFKHFNYKLPTQISTEKGFFYSFVYGNTKFIMLNTNDLTNNALKSEQYSWLENELKNNTCKWTIVGMHNPLYSVGKYGSDPTRNQITLALRNQLQTLFNQYKVDLVLQGHDHAISRTYPINAQSQPQSETFEKINGINYSLSPSGVIYVMNGPAGNQLRAPYSVDQTLFKYAESSYARSWADFEVDNEKITVSVKYFDGNTIKTYYTWGIKK